MKDAPRAALLLAAVLLAVPDDEGMVFIKQTRISGEVIHEQ